MNIIFLFPEEAEKERQSIIAQHSRQVERANTWKGTMKQKIDHMKKKIDRMELTPARRSLVHRRLDVRKCRIDQKEINIPSEELVLWRIWFSQADHLHKKGILISREREVKKGYSSLVEVLVLDGHTYVLKEEIEKTEDSRDFYGHRLVCSGFVDDYDRLNEKELMAVVRWENLINKSEWVPREVYGGDKSDDNNKWGEALKQDVMSPNITKLLQSIIQSIVWR